MNETRIKKSNCSCKISQREHTLLGGKELNVDIQVEKRMRAQDEC